MKLLPRMLVVIMILVLALASMAAAPAAKTTMKISGLYKGVDTLDGSTLQLKITEWLGINRVEYIDKGAAACGGGAVRGKSSAVAIGNALHTYLTLKCVNTGVVVATNYDLALVPVSKTVLVDVFGNSYTLVKGAGCKGR